MRAFIFAMSFLNSLEVKKQGDCFVNVKWIYYIYSEVIKNVLMTDSDVDADIQCVPVSWMRASCNSWEFAFLCSYFLLLFSTVNIKNGFYWRKRSSVSRALANTQNGRPGSDLRRVIPLSLVLFPDNLLSAVNKGEKALKNVLFIVSRELRWRRTWASHNLHWTS